jgi:hypothetical protein
MPAGGGVGEGGLIAGSRLGLWLVARAWLVTSIRPPFSRAPALLPSRFGLGWIFRCRRLEFRLDARIVRLRSGFADRLAGAEKLLGCVCTGAGAGRRSGACIAAMSAPGRLALAFPHAKFPFPFIPQLCARLRARAIPVSGGRFPVRGAPRAPVSGYRRRRPGSASGRRGQGGFYRRGACASRIACRTGRDPLTVWPLAIDPVAVSGWMPPPERIIIAPPPMARSANSQRRCLRLNLGLLIKAPGHAPARLRGCFSEVSLFAASFNKVSDQMKIVAHQSVMKC